MGVRQKKKFRGSYRMTGQGEEKTAPKKGKLVRQLGAKGKKTLQEGDNRKALKQKQLMVVEETPFGDQN